MKKYPLLSSQSQIDQAITLARNKLNDTLSRNELITLNSIQSNFRKGNDTLKKYSTKKGLKKSRKRIHNKILKKSFKDNGTIDRRDPDLYIIGGVAGSGKTEVLRKRVPEKTVVIDNDDFKGELSKYDKSPLPKYPLAHAALLHREADVLVDRSVRRSLKESRDVTMDMTFANYDKGKKLIRRFKRRGYNLLACCCGHGRYNLSIVYKSPKGKIFDLVSGIEIPREKRFYIKDKEGYYYIPEVQNG